jgi:pimeloyl-ACP methyl ester carboxylesterase
MTQATAVEASDHPAGSGPMPDVPGVAVEHEFYDLPAGRFHVARAGDRSLPAILLVHGFPQHWWCWHGVIAALAGEAHIIAPDLRGSGWSSVPTAPGSYLKSDMAADLGQLLDAMGIDEIAVVAHDWGGYLSQLLAIDRPSLVRRLLLLSIPPVIPSGPRPPIRAMLRMNYQLWFSAPASNRWLFPRTTQFAKGLRSDARNRDAFTHEDALVYAKPYADPARAKAGQMMYRSFIGGDLAAITKRLKGKRFSQPVRFILSAFDGYIPPQYILTVPRLGEQVDGWVQDRTGHFLPDEDPAYVADQIREWVLPDARPLG